MRGIAGIIRLDGGNVGRAAIDHVIRTMAIGPVDRIDYWHEKSAGLAYLSEFFLPEDRLERQPLISADDNCVLVAHAFLDNRSELAAAYGWSADDAAMRPDSAFILAAYEKWGEACPAHLSGTFAFALWRRLEQRLYCAIDHLGLAPLYYFRRDGFIAFATTLRGLFALPEVSRELNERMLAEAAVGLRRPSEDTLYRDISRILGGHILTLDERGTRTSRYWNPAAHRTLRLRSDADYLAAFRVELQSAVKRAMRRMPGEIGIFVSGGLDSSATAILAGEILAEEGRRLQVIHLIPRHENRYASAARELDESRYVRELQAHASHLDFHYVPASTESSPIEAWDEYFADHQVPFRGLPGNIDPALGDLLAKLKVGAMLDGRGGNLLVSPEMIPTGYLEHLALTGRWLAWWREVRAHRDTYQRPLRWLVRHTTMGALSRSFGKPNTGEATRWLQSDFRARTGIDDVVRENEARWLAPPVDLRGRFHRLLVERMAQQSGVRPSAISRWPIKWLRISPLGDWRLNEFCAALPFEQQFRDGWDRRLLREIMRDKLPKSIRLRTTRGLGQPEFQAQFAKMEPQLLAKLDHIAGSSMVRAYVDHDYLRKQWLARPAQATWGRELSLVNALVFGCFLQWHERQAHG